MEPQLSTLKCVACRGDEPPASAEEIARMMPHIPDWKIVQREGMNRLERVFEFPDFVSALTFTNSIGAMAEEEGHHPALLTEWGRTTVTWWTHAIGGLHRNDFIAAAKTDRIHAGLI